MKTLFTNLIILVTTAFITLGCSSNSSTASDDNWHPQETMNNIKLRGITTANVVATDDIVDMCFSTDGTKIYAAGHSNGIHIIDKSTLQILDTIDTAGLAHDIKPMGDGYFAAADQNGGLLIFQENGNSLQKVADHKNINAMTVDAINGSIVAVAAGRDGAVIFTFNSTTSTLQKLSSYKTGGYAHAVHYNAPNNHLYVAATNHGVDQLDISNLQAPSLIKTFSTPYNAHDVLVTDNGLLVVAAKEKGVYTEILDDKYGWSNTIETKNEALGLDTYNAGGKNYVVVADTEKGISLIDTTNKWDPQYAIYADSNGFAHQVIVDPTNQFAYLCDGNYGLNQMDVSQLDISYINNNTVLNNRSLYAVIGDERVSTYEFANDGKTVLVDGEPSLYTTDFNTLTINGTRYDTLDYQASSIGESNFIFQDNIGENIFPVYDNQDQALDFLHNDAFSILSSNLLYKNYTQYQFSPDSSTVWLSSYFLDYGQNADEIISDFNGKTFIWNAQPYTIVGQSFFQLVLYDGSLIEYYDINGHETPPIAPEMITRSPIFKKYYDETENIDKVQEYNFSSIGTTLTVTDVNGFENNQTILTYIGEYNIISDYEIEVNLDDTNLTYDLYSAYSTISYDAVNELGVTQESGEFYFTLTEALFHVPLNRSELESLINRYESDPTFDNEDAIRNADTSQITDMSNLFQNNSTFNVDISNWNVSNVTNMSNMFNGATAFNQNLSDWNVSKVTSFGNFSTGALLLDDNELPIFNSLLNMVKGKTFYGTFFENNTWYIDYKTFDNDGVTLTESDGFTVDQEPSTNLVTGTYTFDSENNTITTSLPAPTEPMIITSMIQDGTHYDFNYTDPITLENGSGRWYTDLNETKAAISTTIESRFLSFSQMIQSNDFTASELETFISDDFLNDDMGKNLFATVFATFNTSNIILTNLSVDYSDLNTSTASISFVDNEGVISQWGATKPESEWLFTGNRKIVNANKDYGCGKGLFDTFCGIWLSVEDLNISNNYNTGAIQSVKVSLIRNNVITGDPIYLKADPNDDNAYLMPANELAFPEITWIDTDDFISHSSLPIALQAGDILRLELYNTEDATGEIIDTYDELIQVTPPTTALDSDFVVYSQATLDALDGFSGGNININFSVPTSKNLGSVEFTVTLDNDESIELFDGSGSNDVNFTVDVPAGASIISNDLIVEVYDDNGVTYPHYVEGVY